MTTAIDLYSGIGGWTLGLRMAGIDVIASYEWWADANLTHNKNFGSDHKECDIRKLKIADLPPGEKVDFLVGSPPCTQFSLSNKAGGGDIEDGLIDIKKFLEVVKAMKPKYWAMENVPRVANILKKEMEPKGQLWRYRKLFRDIRIYNSADFGVPQDRRRMIAGDLPFELLDTYVGQVKGLQLKDVIVSLRQKPVVDPIYGFSLEAVTDHVLETCLSAEETRINQESKVHHPIYNQMCFPDRQDRPSRTITATCTRVSRESIIIGDPDESHPRRLTVRERACLQSFPINYQLFGKTYSNKIRMIGNAVPPLLSYYIAQSMLQRPVEKLLRPTDIPAKRLVLSKEKATSHTPTYGGGKYLWNRSFWFAIKGLRFGSGVRFELRNYHNKRTKLTSWRVNFVYGTSKRIKNKSLDPALLHRLLDIEVFQEQSAFGRLFEGLCKFILNIDGLQLQAYWTNKDRRSTGPLQLIDELARYAELFKKTLDDHLVAYPSSLEDIVRKEFSIKVKPKEYQKKLMERSKELFIGMLIGSCFNALLKGESIRIKSQRIRA